MKITDLARVNASYLNQNKSRYLIQNNYIDKFEIKIVFNIILCQDYIKNKKMIIY